MIAMRRHRDDPRFFDQNIDVVSVTVAVAVPQSARVQDPAIFTLRGLPGCVELPEGALPGVDIERFDALIGQYQQCFAIRRPCG